MGTTSGSLPGGGRALWTIIEDRESTNRVLMQESSSLLSSSRPASSS